jgi:hypothetical protein
MNGHHRQNGGNAAKLTGRAHIDVHMGVKWSEKKVKVCSRSLEASEGWFWFEYLALRETVNATGGA